MRIYIATALELREHAAALAVSLLAAGHVVTSRWHDDAEATRTNEGTLRDRDRQAIALANVSDINAASALIWIADYRCRGSLFEVGYALAAGHRVAAVGHAHNHTLMASHPRIAWFATVTEAVQWLERVVRAGGADAQ